MRIKFIAICLLLIALTGVRSDDEEEGPILPFEALEIGKQLEDELNENQRIAYYEVVLDSIHYDQDFVVVVKGKTPFDDPEVRMAFRLTDYMNVVPVEKIYQCQNVGREICIIPAEDLTEKRRTQKQTKIYVEVTQRGNANCHYIIEVEYEEKATYQFGKEYTINLKKDLYKQFILKFDEVLVGKDSLSRIFASVVPLEQGLIEDKIEFKAKFQKSTIEGISIWENGLGANVSGPFSKSSEIEFTIYSSSDQSFVFHTISPQQEATLELQEIKKGYLFQDVSNVYAIDLSKVKGDRENLDLVLHIHPYYGRAAISVNAEKNFKDQVTPNWHFEAWASEQIIIKAEERRKVSRKDEIYYVKVTARTELTYSIKSYLYDKDQLVIQFHDSVAGFNAKDEITNYQLKIVSNDVIQVRIMLFNVQGDNDVYIKLCPVKFTTPCHVTQNDITEYENSVDKNDQRIFLVAKVGDAKREFVTFSHNGKCDDEPTQNTCKYMIALKGTTEGQNKYVLRANNDAQHILLQNNVPFKDKAEKFEFNYYKYQSPALERIKQIDFIITTFVGQVIVRTSTSKDNQYPRRDGYEKINKESQVISYYSKDKKLSETTFYLSAFGEIDTIYTITPHLILEEQKSYYQDPGILILDGVKQDLYLSKQKSSLFFYFKAPFEDNRVPKIQLNLYGQSGEFKVFLDPEQKIILENPEKARFKNNEVGSQLTIHEGTLEGEMILFGKIEPLNQISDDNEQRSVTLYYHTDFIAFEFELNKSHNHFFYKKKSQYFSFQIKDYSNYYISVITNAQNQYKLEFYVSMDSRINRPNHEHQTAKFKAFEGYVIDQYLIDAYCPFIKKNLNEGKVSEQTCNVYITGYAYADVMSTITISNEGSIFYLYEGVNFKTYVPLPNQFSYFVHDILPQVQHTKIEVTTNASHLQIYASILTIDKQDQSLILKKSSFPTSQNSQYQSNLDIFNEGSTTIQLHTKDIKDCQLFGCKALITIDNLDKKFKQNHDNYMNVLVVNDKTIQEIIEGKDYEIPRVKNGISYFKFVVGEDVKSLRVELLGIPKILQDEEENFNYILVSNDASGLPTYDNNQQADILHNMVEILPEKGDSYIKQGMYYFGVILAYVDSSINLRLTTNKIQILNLSLDGRQRDISLDPHEVAYAVVDLHLIEDDVAFELIVLNPTSEYSIAVYANQVFQIMNGIREIEDTVKSNVVVAEMKKDVHRIKFRAREKKTHHYIIKIQSQKIQTLTILLRTKNTVQKLVQGSYFKDVLPPTKYRIFDLQSDYTKVKITLFSGELIISTLPEGKTTIVDDWLRGKSVIDKLQFTSKKVNNSIEIPIKKNQERYDTEYLLIENISDKNEAFYFIENIEIKSKSENIIQTLQPTHPRSGSLKPGETISYYIENMALVQSTLKLSIFFPSLNIRESYNQKVNLPQVSYESVDSSTKIEVADLKKTTSQFYYEFNMDPGKFKLSITRSLDDFSLSTIDNDYTNELEFIISLDTSGIMHVIDNVKYFQKQSSKTSVNVFEYFRQWGTPFIVELYDCLGETSLALSESLNAVQDFSSDLIMRTKTMGYYKYYTFSTFEEEQQNEEDLSNDNDNVDDFVKSSVLYIGAKPRSVDVQSKRAEYILRVSSFPSNQALMLPFEYFYLKDNSIFVEEIESKNQGRGLKFTAPNVRCEQQCLQIRAKVNYVVYQLFVSDSESSLQNYSVCHTNMTNYKDFSITQFPEARSATGILLSRIAVKSNGLAVKSDVQPIFDLYFKDLKLKPDQLFYTVTATVNIQEYGSTKAQNVPVYYKKQKLIGRWWDTCVECEIMRKEKEIREKRDEQIEERPSEEEYGESKVTSIIFVLFMALLALVGLYALYRIYVYCRNRGHYSLKNIFSTQTNSSYELNDYHSYG